ncbi:MAG: hypothetical protein RML33_00430 [Acidobacteriota bacterium]|nr:hypothetical protein [Acidobacteriota bacterium]
MGIVGELRSEIAFVVLADEKYREKITREQAASLIEKIQEALTCFSEEGLNRKPEDNEAKQLEITSSQ